MFGTHLTHCSYLHRFEWLIKKKINYRFEKIFKGYIIKNNEKKFIKENLFARLLKPEAVNDFTILKKAFIDDTKIYFYKKIGIYTIGAKNIKKKFYPLIKKDPFLVLKNKSDFS